EKEALALPDRAKEKTAKEKEAKEKEAKEKEALAEKENKEKEALAKKAEADKLIAEQKEKETETEARKKVVKAIEDAKLKLKAKAPNERKAGIAALAKLGDAAASADYDL